MSVRATPNPQPEPAGLLSTFRPVPLGERVVIITGASSGIGAATAEAFAAAGAWVVLAARREKKLRELAAQLRATGATALVVPTDVADEASRRHLISETLASFGRIDVLVNNAGVALGGAAHELSWERTSQAICLNALGTIRMSQLALPTLLAQGSGHIVNVSSVMAGVPLPGISIYGATKASIAYFTTALRRELVGTGVRASNVLPALVKTPMIDHVLTAYADPDVSAGALARYFMLLVDTPENTARLIVDTVRWRRPTARSGGVPALAISLAERYMPGTLEWVLSLTDPELSIEVTAKL